MATIIRSVTNNRSVDISIFVPGYNAHQPVTIAPSATLDLLSLISEDMLIAIQDQLLELVAAGTLSIAGSADTTKIGVDDVIFNNGNQVITNTIVDTDALTINNTTPSRGLLVNGKIIGRRDNGTSLAVRGLQHSSEGVAVVSSYSGIFTDAGYNAAGTLKTRFITGGNLEMDVELQSPHMLRLTAGDNTTTDASIRMCSNTSIKLEARAENEVIADHYLVVDRLDTTVHGITNTSEVNLKANSGSLYLNSGVTTGAIVLPVLTNAQRGALTPVVGMIFYNSDSGLFNVYDGAWKSIDTTAV